MMNILEKQDKEIRFSANDEEIMEGVMMPISLKDAYHIGFQKRMSAQRSGLMTTLVLLSHSL